MKRIDNQSLRSLLALAMIASFAVACGGKSKNASTGPTKPDDPNKITVGPKKQKIDRKVTKDAVKDFAGAVEFYNEKAKEGWTHDNCKAAAGRFKDVASDHDKMVEARFNAGLAYHQCGMLDAAEKEYEAALRIHGNHAQSISNLGEIYFQRGQIDKAKAQWERAVKVEPKLIAARNNLAWLLLQRLRQTHDKSTWNAIEKEARDHLSSVLAVDNENVKAYILYGLVYMEGSERNKNRLDLASLLLDEAAKRDADNAELHNARGLLYMRKSNLGLALASFQKAVSLKPDFVEAHLNVGNITLGFRKYDTAAAEFSKVLEMQPKSYEALIGLGVAQRGLGDLDKAEENYNAAKKVDSRAGDAYFNLAVLYKDFRANKATDLASAKTNYETARKYFREFLSKQGISKDDREEAQENIKDCEKVMKQLDDVMKAQAAAAKAG